MRKIEHDMVQAVNMRTPASPGNTTVSVLPTPEIPGTEEMVSVSLHGNEIFRAWEGFRLFTLAGWATGTTKSRLRALGVPLVTKRGVNTVYGVEIESREWYRLEAGTVVKVEG